MHALSQTVIQDFIDNGFVRIDDAFPRKLAADCREILWPDLDCDAEDPATWTRPVVRLAGYRQEPFRRAFDRPRLHAALDRLVGRGRWRPRRDLGTIVVRFPCATAPDDTGWHIDNSFAEVETPPGDYSAWRANIVSRGRALLLLFLLSNVGEDDAPTRIRVGSHLDAARVLEPFGTAGAASQDLAAAGLVERSAQRPVAFATGPAGTVYLCHPFLVHAAQPHRGSTPRFLAQPELPPAEPFQLHRGDGDYAPVELAIRRGLQDG